MTVEELCFHSGLMAILLYVQCLQAIKREILGEESSDEDGEGGEGSSDDDSSDEDGAGESTVGGAGFGGASGIKDMTDTDLINLRCMLCNNDLRSICSGACSEYSDVAGTAFASDGIDTY